MLMLCHVNCLFEGMLTVTTYMSKRISVTSSDLFGASDGGDKKLNMELQQAVSSPSSQIYDGQTGKP